jgi:hypothetical protein
MQTPDDLDAAETRRWSAHLDLRHPGIAEQHATVRIVVADRGEPGWIVIG